MKFKLSLIGVALMAFAILGTTRTAYAKDACSLLTPADIAKATGIKVGNGTAEKPLPGVLGVCNWTGEQNRKVSLTLEDAGHMGLTIRVFQQAGGESVAGLGTKAVAAKAPLMAGDGYMAFVLDAKGGFGVTVLGKEGTRGHIVALAKIVESHR